MDDQVRQQEWQQIIAVSQDDVKAFNRIFLTYQPKLFIFINGFIKDTEASKDLCEDVFLKIWQHRKRIENVENLNSFLFKMTQNAIFNYLKHNKISHEYVSQMLMGSVESENAEEMILYHLLQEDIDKVVDQLSEQRRNVFRLSREEGYSNAEISTQLNISKRTVENHITASLHTLRKVLRNILTLFFLIKQDNYEIERDNSKIL